MITNTDILRKYVSVSKELHDERIEPFNAHATKFMSRFIAKPLQNELVAFSTETGVKLEAHNLYMSAYSNALMVYAIPNIEVVITDAGVTRAENQTAKTAFSGQMKNLLAGYENTAFDMVESLIELLNANASIFTAWNNTSPGKAMTELIVFKTAASFDKIFTLFRPTITFVKLIDSIDSVQDVNIIPTISQENFALVLTIDDSSSAEKKKILKNMQRAVAHFTFAEELKKANIQFGPDGLRVKSFDYNVSNEIENQPPPQTAQLSAHQMALKGSTFLDLAIKAMALDADFSPINQEFTKHQPWF